MISVNLHITNACNYQCNFCFAHFNETNNLLRFKDWQTIIKKLKEVNCQKITFVGGEPLLHPDLAKLLAYTKSLGITTSIVTNGSLLTPEFLEANHQNIDWIGFSIDSIYEATEIKLGRTSKRQTGKQTHPHIDHILSLLPLLCRYGTKIKINTVVTALTWQEDMTGFIQTIKPNRWKAFQVLPIKGENDQYIDQLQISVGFHGYPVLTIEQSLDYLNTARKAIIKYKVENAKQFSMRIEGAIGKNYNLHKNYQKAIEHLEKAVSYANEIQQMKYLPFLYRELGIAHAHLDNKQEAIKMFRESRSRFQALGMPERFQTVDIPYVILKEVLKQ